MQPDISIIIPVYNGEKFISKCLNSILLQTYRNFEIIVIDDGSIDNTVNILKKYQENYKNVKFFYQQNNGVSAARNLGIKKSKGKFLMFVDSDDYVKKDFCEKMIYLITETNADCAYCNYYVVKEGGIKNNKLPKKYLTNKEKQFENKQNAIEGIFNNRGFRGFVWNKIYRRESIEGINFDESIIYFEDMLFNINVINKCAKISYTSDSLYYYKYRKDSVINSYNTNYFFVLKSFDIIMKQLDNDKLYRMISFDKEAVIVKFSAITKYKYNEEYDKWKYEYFKNYKKEKINFRFNSKQDYIFNLILIFSKVNFNFGTFLMYKYTNIKNGKI